jgi:outer membrane protein assembly factor BamA
MDNERSRITEVLKNNGYYFFSPDYVVFEVDSNFKAYKTHIKISIINRKVPGKKLGSFITKPHYRYYINKIEITPEYDPIKYTDYKAFKHTINVTKDSSYSYTFYCHLPKARFNLNTFNSVVKIVPNKPYSLQNVKDTYKRLFNFAVIASTTITFDTVSKKYAPDTVKHYLDSQIKMRTSALNYFSVESVVTNSSGDPGIKGNFMFVNKNIFKHAEMFRIRVNGGFEAQTIIDSTGVSSWFNTFEAGIDLSVLFPRFLSPIKFKKFTQKYYPTTTLNLSFNYQKRPNYDRNSTNLYISYSWKKTQKISFLVSPFVLNFVNIFPTPEFQDILDEETNLSLKEQYSDHFIFGISTSIIYDDQRIKKGQNFNFVRLDFETSGNLLYGMEKLFNGKKNEDGFYQLFGVPFSQYVRIMVDYRHYYHFFNLKNVIAFRTLAGIAVPFLNSNQIPYEKGFYAGGANDMRGWKFRTLGPGAYTGSDEDFERIGEMQFEGNVEYRFPIYDWFRGALFVDAGNIWTFNNENYPGGAFKFNTFYKQIALDMGVGLRFDFTYFVFRLDAGIPFRDPAFPEDERWRFKYWKFRDFVLNFGIGYPF